MNVRATASVWESDVLEVRVGTLLVDTLPQAKLIRMENRGVFDVVFVSSGQWHDPPVDAVAVDHLYDMEIENAGQRTKSSCVSSITFPSRKHVEIATEALHESRFLRDHRLRDKSAERYVRWLTEHKVYVPAGAPDSAFLVATDDPVVGCRRISLVAVEKEYRSTGIGAKLVTGAFAVEPTQKVWRVKVSSRNHRAIRFYEGLGFRVKSVSTVFHVWVTDEK